MDSQILLHFNRSTVKKIFKIKMYGSLSSRDLIIFSKSCHIPNCFNNYLIRLYKGCSLKSLYVDKFNLSLRLGIFVFTRKPNTFINKKKKKSNKVRR